MIWKDIAENLVMDASQPTETTSFKTPLSPKRIRSLTNLSKRSRQNLSAPKPIVTTSTDDISSISDFCTEHGYLTELTTPDSSDICAAERMCFPDDVEDFRDREYPQLKGKTYLDHAGTTVCLRHSYHHS